MDFESRSPLGCGAGSYLCFGFAGGCYFISSGMSRVLSWAVIEAGGDCI